MSRIIYLLILILATAISQAQTPSELRHKKLIADQQFVLRNTRVDSIKNDTTGLAGSSKTLLTANAVYDFVAGRSGAIPTLQQVLTAGSYLTQPITITGTGQLTINLDTILLINDNSCPDCYLMISPDEVKLASANDIILAGNISLPMVNAANSTPSNHISDSMLVIKANHYVGYRSVPFGLRVSTSLDFPSTNAGTNSDLTITLIGAVAGDIVVLGTPNSSVSNNSCYTAWVSAANTVTVRFNNYGSIAAVDPASGNFKVSILK